jgi:cytochrome c oxidase cbb3-type subunit III
MAHKEVDTVTGIETTGHEWDGIKELNTPLPKWWLYVFYATIVWALAYSVAYPSWPWLSGYTKGLLDYSSRQQLNERMAALDASRADWSDRILATSLEDIVEDPDLLRIATAGGRIVFANNCAPCHGTGATGRPGGYPALVDDDWIWGGTLEDIHATIIHGIRSADPESRVSEMPAYGADGILSAAEINAVAEHVLAISGQGPENAQGATIFAENCAACHGELGRGEAALGAPNLTDQIWLYGGSKQAIVSQISRPRLGVMPPWNTRLSDVEIKQATVYVHSLGGGQ